MKTIISILLLIILSQIIFFLIQANIDAITERRYRREDRENEKLDDGHRDL
ncbi:hypothetical protein [Allofustis seminis]|uniref:hypothetical protein n=1 Tax=Allofustis seminis TaxID=166939 RepID=UPI00037A8F2D|nr:hypothetical protein [Allofustis seminis]